MKNSRAHQTKPVGQPNPTAGADHQKHNVFWLLLTAFLVSASLYLIVVLSKRFVGDDSFLKAFVQPALIIIQAALALLTAGTLSQPVSQWAEKLLTQLGLYKKYGVKKRCGIALLITILLLGIWCSLPIVSMYYVRQGNLLLESNPASARKSFQRALSLDPENAAAHFGMGTSYENDGLFDQAIPEYIEAILADGKLYKTRLNLSRCYLYRGNGSSDFQKALDQIDVLTKQLKAENLAPEGEFGYQFYRNRGWASYGLGSLPQANQDLQRAVSIDENRPGRVDNEHDLATPHCLLGYVLDKQGRRKEAKSEWQSCLSLWPDDNVRREFKKGDWKVGAEKRLSEKE